MMAALFAAREGARVALVERNEKLGKKLYITGKGRCNLTNAADAETFQRRIFRNPRFLYASFAAMDNVETMRLFESLGVPLKGASLHTEPVFEPQGGRRTGYRAARRLKAELSADPARLAAIAETLSRSGAEPSFSAEYFLSDERAARREAAALAVGEARERAQAIAAAAGVRLGRILRIESGARAFPAVRAMALRADEAADLAPDEIGIGEDVSVIFAIE